MKTASISDLKKELSERGNKDLLHLCLRMAKYKKENKELLTYLLFESEDEQRYREQVKAVMDEAFADMPKAPLYQASKALRKILRQVNKYIRFSGDKQTEAELLLYFLNHFRKTGLKIQHSVALYKLFDTQMRKITKAIEGLHEDLQYDYQEELRKLS